MTTTYAERLKSALKDKGWDIRALSNATGLPYPTLKGLENGHQKSSTDTPAIAAALGVAAVWLSSGKGPRIQAQHEMNVKGQPPEMRTTSQFEQPDELIVAEADKWLRIEERVLGQYEAVRRGVRLIALYMQIKADGGSLTEDHAAALIKALHQQNRGEEDGRTERGAG